MEPSLFLPPDFQADLVDFTQRLVRIKSTPGQEEQAIRLAEAKMKALGCEEVTIDAMGNLLGRIGRGPKSILFDSHVDTVDVPDASHWEIPPFSGEIVDGRLYGRGSVDMKSGAAASLFAASWAHRLGWDEGKTVYVSYSVLEEDCDGENLKHLFRERSLRPDAVVICEPSKSLIAVGHKGKAQVAIKTQGISAHGSAPEKGLNAIYEMAEIIQRVERANAELERQTAPRGTLVMSRIASTAASLNAVPFECEVYLDRRIAPGETEEAIRQEMDRLVEGKRARWEVGTIARRSWTGLEVRYEPFHPAWRIAQDHALTRACAAAYSDTFGHAPREYDFWDFSTNAVTPVRLGIPTIGFGPGDYKLAHMRNENCPIQDILEACEFYTRLIAHF